MRHRVGRTSAKADPSHPFPFRNESNVAVSVSEWRDAHSLTLAATKAYNQLMNLRPPILTCCLVAISVAIHFLPPAFATSLQFDRAALEAGQWWRWFTSHLTHFGANHLVWDAAVLRVLGTACEFRSRWRTAITLGLASLTVSAAVYLWQPEFALYRGLSGLDCALFGMFAAGLLLRKDPIARILGAGAIVAMIAKCLFEFGTGSTAFASGVGYAPVPLAHLVGFLAGIAAEWSVTSINRWRHRRQPFRLSTSRMILNPSRARRHPPSPSRRASVSTP